MKLKDKIALITGAGIGIGKATAILLAKEGVHVVVNDIDIESAQKVVEQILSFGLKAVAIQADVTDRTQVNKMVNRVVTDFERIDILVNNAGIAKMGNVVDIEERDWDNVLAVNLKGTFLVSQAVVKAMIKQQSGKIINMASLAGRIGGVLVGAHYAASKGGVIAFTKSLAKEVVSYGITVNAVAPGTIDTPLVNMYGEQGKRELAQKIPLGRLGTPEEVAYTVLFLASSAGDYYTGATLDMNGGLAML